MSNPYVLILAFVVAALASIAIFCPEWINDENNFLKDFINHEYLNVLGVMLAITLASLAQIHLSLNRIEERRQQKIFRDSRKEIRESAYYLIGCFCAGVIIVITKPLLKNSNFTSCIDVTAIINAVAIFILLFCVFIMLEVTQGAFSIPADIKDGNEDE